MSGQVLALFSACRLGDGRPASTSGRPAGRRAGRLVGRRGSWPARLASETDFEDHLRFPEVHRGSIPWMVVKQQLPGSVTLNTLVLEVNVEMEVLSENVLRTFQVADP